MRFHSHLRGRLTSLGALTIGVLTIVCPSDASAHVKWFAPFNVASEPRSLLSVLSPTFGYLFLISLVVMFGTAVVERTPFGSALLDTLDRIGGVFRSRTEALLRACAGAFLVALFVLGNVILTPELKTQSAIIPWLQVVMAIGLFWRPTMVLTGFGIVALYVIRVANYGVFHLLDYPIFLGLAAFFILSGLGLKLGNLRPLDVARWGAGITLMWASIEKWAYPQWTYPLLVEHPKLAFNWDPSFYMTAAGVIEFGLAFGLIWTPLVRRLAAVVLSAMFISAIFEFGKIDAIGHLMIIAILLCVIADDSPQPAWRPIWAPVFYIGALAGILTAYYTLHAALFRVS